MLMLRLIAVVMSTSLVVDDSHSAVVRSSVTIHQYDRAPVILIQRRSFGGGFSAPVFRPPVFRPPAYRPPAYRPPIVQPRPYSPPRNYNTPNYNSQPRYNPPPQGPRPQYTPPNRPAAPRTVTPAWPKPNQGLGQMGTLRRPILGGARSVLAPHIAPRTPFAGRSMSGAAARNQGRQVSERLAIRRSVAASAISIPDLERRFGASRTSGRPARLVVGATISGRNPTLFKLAATSASPPSAFRQGSGAFRDSRPMIHGFRDIPIYSAAGNVKVVGKWKSLVAKNPAGRQASNWLEARAHILSGGRGRLFAAPTSKPDGGSVTASRPATLATPTVAEMRRGFQGRFLPDGRAIVTVRGRMYVVNASLIGVRPPSAAPDRDTNNSPITEMRRRQRGRMLTEGGTAQTVPYKPASRSAVPTDTQSLEFATIAYAATTVNSDTSFEKAAANAGGSRCCRNDNQTPDGSSGSSVVGKSLPELKVLAQSKNTLVVASKFTALGHIDGWSGKELKEQALLRDEIANASRDFKEILEKQKLETLKTYQSNRDYRLAVSTVRGSIDKESFEGLLKKLFNTQVLPHPREYIKDYDIYRKKHLQMFEGGVTKIVQHRKSAPTGDNPRIFVLPKAIADDVISRARGNVKELERLLGLPPGDLGDAPHRIDIADPAGLDIPTGNEKGANHLWLPGGYNSGGLPEAVIDSFPYGTYPAIPVW